MLVRGEAKWLMITIKRLPWLILPEEEGPGPLDIPLTVALHAGLEDEGVSVEVVVRGDGAVLTAAAGVLHHHRHRQGDTAEVLWGTRWTEETLKLPVASCIHS